MCSQYEPRGAQGRKLAAEMLQSKNLPESVRSTYMKKLYGKIAQVDWTEWALPAVSALAIGAWLYNRYLDKAEQEKESER